MEGLSPPPTVGAGLRPALDHEYYTYGMQIVEGDKKYYKIVLDKMSHNLYYISIFIIQSPYVLHG
jgi:hypothetical protein